MTGPAPFEAERDRLVAQRERLTAKLDSVVRTLAAAFETRRYLHLSGSTDAAALKRSEEAVRSVESERAGLEDALRHLATQLEDVERQLTSRADAAAREAAAADIDARRERLGVVVARLDQAAEAFAAVRAELVKVFEADAPREGPFDRPDHINVIAAAARLARVSQHYEMDGFLGLPTCAGGAAIGMLSGMRDLAAAIRSGEAPIPTSKAPEAEWQRLKSAEKVTVTLSRPIQWIGGSDRMERSPSGTVELPEDVAAEARKLGIGFDPRSDDAKAIVLALRSEGGQPMVFRDPDGRTWGKLTRPLIYDEGDAKAEAQPVFLTIVLPDEAEAA